MPDEVHTKLKLCVRINYQITPTLQPIGFKPAIGWCYKYNQMVLMTHVTQQYTHMFSCTTDKVYNYLYVSIAEPCIELLTTPNIILTACQTIYLTIYRSINSNMLVQHYMALYTQSVYNM